MFDSVNALYSSLLSQHGNTSSAVGIPRDNQAERFASVCRHLPSDRGFTLLDYGCGLGHLGVFLSDIGASDFRYTGVDINSDFLDAARRINASGVFMSRDELFGSEATFDYSVAIGTFNLLYGDRNLQQDFVFDEVRRLFGRTDVALFLNFMHTEVDFVQVGAWHQSVGDLFRFVKAELSSKLILDSTYLEYEFTAVIYRE